MAIYCAGVGMVFRIFKIEMRWMLFSETPAVCHDLVRSNAALSG